MGIHIAEFLKVIDEINKRHKFNVRLNQNYHTICYGYYEIVPEKIGEVIVFSDWEIRVGTLTTGIKVSTDINGNTNYNKERLTKYLEELINYVEQNKDNLKYTEYEKILKKKISTFEY